MTYWPRKLADCFARTRGHFPAVLITGPRQSGKTTFLRQEAADCAYATFDDPRERAFARDDPNNFLGAFGDDPVILDEVQYVPELFSYLKMLIDKDPSLPGRFLMTGSQQFVLMKQISDSLAGRLAILDLYPFSYGEIPPGRRADIQAMLWRGGYPPVCVDPDRRDLWLRSYVQSYLERDVRQLQNVHNLALFETFLGLCAARHGNLLNKADLARRAGVSQPAIQAWLSVLEASYVVYLLRPYHRNFGKRLTKSPKLFFVDSGLAAWLTRQPSPEALWRGAAGGAFFEGWVVMEAAKLFADRGREPSLYFWRSHDGTEVDLLIDVGGKTHAVEIRQTATPQAGHADSLVRWRAVAGEAITGDLIVACTVSNDVPLGRGVHAIPWWTFPEWLDNKINQES